MKKTVTLFAMLAAFTFPILAGVLPYGLPDDFTLDYLIAENFELSSDNGAIDITPPGKHMEKRDAIIYEFKIPDIAETDSWITAMARCYSDVSYEDCRGYVSSVLGDGVSESNTRFLLERYSSEPSEEMIFSLLFSGELGEYLVKAVPAMLIKSILPEEEIEKCMLNMWNGDGITIYTLGYEEEKVIIYVHDEVIEDFLDSAMETLLMSGLLD